MNILIMKPKDGKFSVHVSVEPIGVFTRNKEEHVDTRKIKEILRSKGIEFGECLKSAVVTNTNPLTRMGEWVFSVPEENPIVEEKSLEETEERPITKKRRSRRKTQNDDEISAVESEEE